MFRHFITGINYAKLISMQANQESFAPHAISRKAQLKIENKKEEVFLKDGPHELMFMEAINPYYSKELKI